MIAHPNPAFMAWLAGRAPGRHFKMPGKDEGKDEGLAFQHLNNLGVRPLDA